MIFSGSPVLFESTRKPLNLIKSPILQTPLVNPLVFTMHLVCTLLILPERLLQGNFVEIWREFRGILSDPQMKGSNFSDKILKNDLSLKRVLFSDIFRSSLDIFGVFSGTFPQTPWA